MLELDDLARHIIFAGNPLPIVGDGGGGDRLGGEGHGERPGEHGPAIDLHAISPLQARR